MNKITMRSGTHGTYQCSTESLELMISRYLPASRLALVQLVAERHGQEVSYWQDLTLVEALMVLAELDGLATN